MNAHRVLLLVPLLFAALFCAGCSAQEYEGDRCIVQRTGQIGVCKMVTQCKTVQDEIRKKIQPTKCGFVNRVQVVCCPLGFIAQKCNEYGKSAFETVPLYSPDGAQSEYQQDMCGFKARELIVGGEKAKVREFPHQALIGYGVEPSVRYLCGASLVSELFVITAAHCKTSEFGKAGHVRLGELNLASTDDGARPENFKIAEFISHPMYNSSSVYNDIALVKLDRIVKFSPYIYPICLPQQFAITQQKAIVTGFGAIEFAERSSDHLLKVTLDFFTYQECNSSYEFDISRKMDKGIIEATQICAGSYTEVKDSCQGDSGGPLQVFNTEVYCTYNLIGIVSFGKGCGTVGQPAIYTRVFGYLPWITTTIWNTTVNGPN